MIVTQERGGLVVVAQEDHAHAAGELAAGLELGLPDRSALIAAARVHDNGWREADAAPTVDPDGAPHTYRTLPDEVYTAVWRRGIARAAAVDPLVGLYVGLHGARFLPPRKDAGARAFHAEERARQDQVLTDLGHRATWERLPAAIEAASAWVLAVDALSLHACGQLGDGVDLDTPGGRLSAARQGASIRLTPWPFTIDEVALEVPARRLDRPRFDDDDDLRTAVAAAPGIAVRATFRPA